MAAPFPLPLSDRRNRTSISGTKRRTVLCRRRAYLKLISKKVRFRWKTVHLSVKRLWMKRYKISQSTHDLVTYCGCILYRDPSMPTVVRTRVMPLFSFSLSRMPDRTAAIRLAERKDTMVQTWRGEAPQSSQQCYSGACAATSLLKLELRAPKKHTHAAQRCSPR